MSSTEEGEEKPLPSQVPLVHLRRAKALLRRLGKHPLRGLGQHFLVDTGVLGKMVAAAQLMDQDTVVEVGPGLGILTQELARRASRVIAVELDAALADFLRQNLAGYPNITVVQADILKTDPGELLDRGEGSRPSTLDPRPYREGEGSRPLTLDPRPYKVVADLPYYITSPVLRHFLEARVKPHIIVVMVQREVARRLVARPGAMSLLSLGVQLYGRPSLVATVSPRSFYPAPKVHSAIVRIEVYPQPAVEVPPEAFFRVARAGFGQPRKQLRNTLAAGLGLTKEAAEALLARAGIDPQRRPQTLSLEEWAAVTRSAGDAAGSRGTTFRKGFAV